MTDKGRDVKINNKHFYMLSIYFLYMKITYKYDIGLKKIYSQNFELNN